MTDEYVMICGKRVSINEHKLTLINQLTTLPPEIKYLTQLTHLNIDNNLLTTLPPEIKYLTQLTCLDIDDNQLTTLPPEIKYLTQLTHLYIDNNQLTTLPPEIKYLTKLTILNASDNKLIKLPPEIIELPDLDIFLYGNNEIMSEYICNECFYYHVLDPSELRSVRFKIKNTQYCKTHLCEYPYCRKKRRYYPYCVEHTCPVDGCDKISSVYKNPAYIKIPFSSMYCELHNDNNNDALSDVTDDDE